MPSEMHFALTWNAFAPNQLTHKALAAGSLPCDIYTAAGTPCVAAHSTVRALFSAYNGRLYQVKSASDSATTDIKTLSVGGYANATTQASFCAGTSCTITIIYDQSSKGNNLKQPMFQGKREEEKVSRYSSRDVDVRALLQKERAF